MVEAKNSSKAQVDVVALDTAIDSATRYLLKEQYPEGYWWGQLESNATIEAEFILLTRFLEAVDGERERKVVNHILSR